MLNITDALLSNYNRPKTKLISLKGIVVHWTANTNKGADAIRNRNYFQNLLPNGSQTTYASAHYVVDDHSIIRCIPDDELAYHVGAAKYTPTGDILRKHTNGKTYTPNYFTIGIEMCVNTDGIWERTYKNTVELVSFLLKKFQLTTAQLYRHYDITGKNCPAMMIEEENWKQFKRAVEEEVNIELPSAADLPTLKKGSTGHVVKDLQQKLNYLGYTLIADGDFGAKTENAVRLFQKSKGLVADGIVGAKTWTKLMEKL